MGDLYMSSIHTCKLMGANAFDYLAELQRHASELKKSRRIGRPGIWRKTLLQTDVQTDASVNSS